MTRRAPHSTRPDERVLTVGDVELTIDVGAGARATRWIVDGLSLLTRYGPGPEESGMYPMAPWAGRLRDNAVEWDGRRAVFPASFGRWAIHGTVLAGSLSVLEHEQGADHARLVARASDHQGWPWAAEVDIAWDLRPRVLTTTITVHAREVPFPTVVGWHPWFARRLGRGAALEWSIDATARAERGDDHLPTGALLPYRQADGPFDDAFAVPDGRATVRWPGALEIDITGDASWFVVFDQLDVAACIEPQSGPPNGLNDGLGGPIPVSSPGHPHQLTTTWVMSDDRPGVPA